MTDSFFRLVPGETIRGNENASYKKIVLVDAYEEYSRLYHNIRMDDELGGYLAARHLAERGHSRIAFVAPGINNPIDRRRFLGFENALKEHHISVNPEWIFF
ncbi:hypothetical protein GCM10020331_072010 [Ectobacillus funiculus]